MPSSKQKKKKKKKLLILCSLQCHTDSEKAQTYKLGMHWIMILAKYQLAEYSYIISKSKTIKMLNFKIILYNI